MAELETKTGQKQGKENNGLKGPSLPDLSSAPKMPGRFGLAGEREPEAPETGLDLARKLFGRALVRSPQDAAVCVLNGWVYHGLGNLQQAADFFKKALAIDPENAEALVGEGSVHAHLGNYDKALKALKDALKKNLTQENRALGNLLLASVFRKMECPEEAIRAASEAIAACESDAMTRAQRVIRAAHLEAASALLAKGEVEKAVDHFELALAEEGRQLKRSPDKPLVALQRALTMLG